MSVDAARSDEPLVLGGHETRRPLRLGLSRDRVDTTLTRRPCTTVVLQARKPFDHDDRGLVLLVRPVASFLEHRERLEERPRSHVVRARIADPWREATLVEVRPLRVLGFEARPKSFKSGTAHSLLLTLARQGVPSAYFALEMGSARLAKRMLGHVGGFNSAMFKHVDERTITRTIEATRTLGAMPLWFVDCPGMKFARLRAAAAQLTTAYGVRAFVLDYWQLVNPDQPTRNKADFLADVAQWCADHAHEHGTTWLICSQENRTGESYGSDGLVKACDWHAVLHKHEQKLHLGDTAVETLWMDVKFARDGTGDSIGDDKTAVLYIDPRGPHLAEIG